MKIQNYIKGLALMVALSFGYTMEVSAQCAPTFSGAKCVGAPITFFHNSPGATNVEWTFGSTNDKSNVASPTYSFTAAGTYKVCVTLTTGSNQPCTSCVDVVVVPNPEVKTELLTSDTQCFNGNNFRYIDSSEAAPGSSLTRVVYSWSDGEFQTFNNPKLGFGVTKKFQDPNGGTYDLTIEIEDANGCIVIKKFPSSVTVRASLGLNFFIPSDEKCDSVEAKVSNSSRINQSQITWFEWDFKDGTKNTTDWKPAPNHWYFNQGPDNGWWDVQLTVESVWGCRDSITAKNAVRNLLLDVRIVSDKDSTCLSEPEIQFDIINLVRKRGGGFDTTKVIPGITGFVWDYGHPNPPAPIRYNNQSLASSHSYGMGPWEASFTYFHPICGNRKIFDTILVIGPTAAIEAPPQGIVILQKHRYQCVARDTVQFVNTSTFYHNDPNMWDDDSTYRNNNPLGHYFDAAQHSIEATPNKRENQHVTRMWDFGDQYAPQCTTNTAAGLNVGKNCNFSMDSLPRHWYTDWEDIYRDSFYARNTPFDQIRYDEQTNTCYNERLDTFFNKAGHREYFWKNIPTVFNVRLELQDTVHPLKCKHSTSTIITLLGASAKNVRFDGVFCLGGASPQYGVNLYLDDTKPGATSNWAFVNWDVNLDPNAWLEMHDSDGGGAVQQGARPGGLPVLMPYGMNGMYGTTYSTAYTAAMIKNRKTGCVKIGVIVGTGVTPTKYPECVDTIYYEDAVCFPVIDPAFEVLEPEFRAASDPAVLKICKNTELVMKLTDDNLTNTDVVNFLEWRLTTSVAGPDTNLRTGYRIFESYLRNQTDPNDPTRLLDILYTTRLTTPLQTQTQNIQDVVTSSDTIVVAHITKWDTAVNFAPIWDAVDERLKDVGFDIFELTSAQIRKMFGVQSCGLDTTGLSAILKSLEYIQPLERVTKHFRDTTILPFEQRTINGKTENVVVFKPAHNGLYNLSLTMDGGIDHCVIGASRLVSVGFYSKVWYNDSIVCHQDLAGLKAKSYFYYYNTNPLIPSILDYNPYWDPRENPGRKYGGNNVSGTKEDFVKWDWSVKDDDLGNPVTIFGGTPYSNTGYDTLTLGGGIPGTSIYYKDWGIYQMRITTGDSTRSPDQCRDTLFKNLYVTDVQAGFALSSNRPQCTNIVEVFDTSKMFDPCVDTFWVSNAGDTIRKSCDNIVTYYINFGDGKGFTQWPADVWRKTKIGWNYTSNGDYTITLIVETDRGCRDTVTQDIYIPGPQPKFETISSREICVNDFVSFANRSNNPSSSAKWTWSWGDGNVFSTTFASSNGGKDTVNHVYSSPGTYEVFLTQFDSIPNTNKFCPGTYPDTIQGKQLAITILVNPIDSVKLFADGERDTLFVCPDQIVNFNVEADKAIYSSFVFGFGDGDSTTISDTVTTHSYSNSGTYVATINPKKDPILTRLICPMVDTVIIVVQDVKADFDIDSSDAPNFCFKNTSTGATDYRWGYYHKDDIVPGSKELFEDLSTKDKKDVCNNYRDSLGKWYVCLEATNSIGCKDTVCKIVEYWYLFEFTPYNVFTPNKNSDGGDLDNDVFKVDIIGHTKFSMTIVNRWGQKVFSTEDSEEGWNGKVNNTGALSPDGTYYYVITYENEEDDEEHVMNGVVTLIREKQ